MKDWIYFYIEQTIKNEKIFRDFVGRNKIPPFQAVFLLFQQSVSFMRKCFQFKHMIIVISWKAYTKLFT